MLKFNEMARYLLLMLMSAALLLGILSGCSDDKTTAPENHAPIVNSVMANPANVSPGGTATITVSATDSDGDVLSYSYTVTGGTIVPNGASATWTLPTAAGAYAVNVSVSDGKLNATGTCGCQVAQQPTRIIGTLTLRPGVAGDLSNTKVSIYANVNDWLAYAAAKFVSSTGSGNSVTFIIDNVPAGTWYLDAWKDIDASLTWTVGDLVGWYGSGDIGGPSLSPFTVALGETKTINMTVDVIR